MTRTMYDTVDAHSAPAGAGLLAGYVNGKYANMDALRKRYPHALLVGIAVTADHDGGVVLDVERGDATPAEAPGWVTMRRHDGVDPTVYCSASIWPQVRAAFHVEHVAEPHYWIAQWDDRAVLPAGAVAKQYINTPGYDVSVVAAYWPGVDPHPGPPPVHAGGTYTVVEGDNLSTIAVRHGVSLTALEHVNPQIRNYDLIFPGQVIHLP
jgi:nucleoid-associated protein YgaU